jgi:hypothetical protein
MAAVTGIPVPMPRPVPALSDEDFPCRNHACGCLSAAMCRTACCCEKSVAVVVREPTPEPEHSCCQAKTSEAEPPPKNASEPTAPEGVPVLTALSCQGIWMVTLTAAPVLSPVDNQVVIAGPTSLAGELLTALETLPPGTCLDVPVPPPRAFPASLIA